MELVHVPIGFRNKEVLTDFSEILRSTVEVGKWA